jgi:micrococcal nuclease
MLRKKKLSFIVALAFLSLLAISSAYAAKVIRVIDGDTIELEGGVKVRYIGIDTPETVHPSKPVQFMGKEASAFNRQLVEGKDVRLEYDVQRTDKYGRTLAYVYVGDTFVNAELVKQGYAQIMTIPPNVKYQDLFLKLQKEAREAKLGLWSDQAAAEWDMRAQAVSSSKDTSKSSADDSTTYYITKTGRKYHRSGCRYLAHSAFPIAEKDALARGYTPCLVCIGSTAGSSKALPSVSPSPRKPSSAPAVSSGRCQAITKKGTQCKRNAAPGSRFCWQHGGK